MKSTKIFLVGGGSGGHVTPLVSIARALKVKDSSVEIAHIGQRGDPMNEIAKRSSDITHHFHVQAGKFRRYHGQSQLQKLLDLKTFVLNVRDFFRFLRGFVQAYRLLRREKPAVLCMKGGYVCAPVGLAAGLLKIPYITHDSDAMVSLAHRIIAKRASLYLTAFPKKHYAKYDAEKIVQVGIPISEQYQPASPASRLAARKQLSIAADSAVVLVTGGGLGARVLNEAMSRNAAELLADPSVVIIHVTGDKTFEQTKAAYERVLRAQDLKRVHLVAFAHNLHELARAADVIVCRAGATNIAEFATLGSACIIVPSPFLAGGHQLQNAAVLERSGAAVIIQESELETSLQNELTALLHDGKRRESLKKALQNAQSHSAASEKIATYLLEYAHKTRG